MVGWLAGAAAKNATPANRVEDVLVGVFGAFAGGEFLLAQFSAAPPPVVKGAEVAASGGFSVAAVGMGIAGAIVMLMLLRMMRGAVGPMRNSKPRARK